MALHDRSLIVQNYDTSITYVGDWTTVQASVVNDFGNYGPAFSTFLYSTTKEGSFSFPFHGSSITLIGSINITNAMTDPDPTWQCVLDGIAFPPNIFQFPENNWLLCNQENISDGPHELIVNVTSKGMPFYLDHIKYRPSGSISLENTLIMVENVDSAINYISGWSALGTIANQTTDPRGLVNVTFVGMRYHSSHFSAYKPAGIQLYWYGFIPNEEPHNASSGEYSIDSQPFISFQLTGLSPPNSNLNTEYNQLFFSTPILGMGDHILSVRYTGSTGQTPLTLDYLVIAHGSESSISSSTAPSMNSQSPSNSSKHGPEPIVIANSATTNDNVRSSSNIGVIVGPVGTIASLVIITIIVFIWRKRGCRSLRGFNRIRSAPGHTSIIPEPLPQQLYPSSQHSGRHDSELLPNENNTISSTTLAVFPNTLARLPRERLPAYSN